MTTPWTPDHLARQVKTLTDALPTPTQHTTTSVDTIQQGVNFHLNFLDHNLKHAIFPSQTHPHNPPAPFAHDPRRRFLTIFTASARPGHTAATTPGDAALDVCVLSQPGGKPVVNQSALHGFHVFEGLQLLVEPTSSGGYRFGYTFLHDKVAKLVDGILRLRFAVHLLKASVLIRHLENDNHPDVHKLKARFSQIVNHDLPRQRSQAEQAVTHALHHFAALNREEMIAAIKSDAHACFYVRVEAQGGNRESVGQGPIGVGQSTLQILGQHAQKPNTPAQVVMNPNAPPRMHTLAGPFSTSPFHALLNNMAVHHGNMGHQHLASEMAQPHGSDMLMFTAEMDVDGRLQGPFVAETNFSNIGFEYNGHFVFPESTSATYGLTQHIIRGMLADELEKGSKLEGISSFEHAPLSLESFKADLRDGKVTGAFVMGSMPGIRSVSAIHVDETLSGGSITSFAMDHESRGLKSLIRLYQSAYREQIVWQ